MPDPVIAAMDAVEFLDSLEADSVDLILTDPPYAISRESNYTNTKDPRYAKHEIDFGDWDHAPPDLAALAPAMHRALRDGGTAIVFYDLWKLESLADAMAAAKFKQPRFIEWLKDAPVPINSKINYLTNAREAAASFTKGSRPTFRSEYDNGVYTGFTAPKGKKRIHPTQKPLPLFEEIIEKHSQPGDLVVDPFCGSGTALLAAKNMGRRWEGCDINPKWTAAANERIQASDDSLL